MYHSVGETRKDDHYGLSVATREFAEHLKIIKEINCKVVSIAAGDKLSSLASNQLCIGVTFDDGYSDNLDAVELLVRDQIPFSVYCIGSAIGQSGYLTHTHLRDLASTPLCTIGGHGWTHTPLGSLSDNDQFQELKRSKDFLEDVIGSSIRTMSLPHGSLNRHTIQIAQKVGFELISTSRPGINHVGGKSSSYLKRTEVRPQHVGSKFRDLIAGTDDWREASYLAKAILSPLVRSQWRPFTPLTVCSIDARGGAK